MDFWTQFGDFISNNIDIISFGTIATTISGIAGYILVKKVLPQVMDRFLMFLSKVIAKMFGQDVEEVSETVQKLPFVEKMRSMEQELHLQNELRLIELKNKIVSPKLSESERIAYQGMFDQLVRQLGDSVSAATIMTLDAIEAAAKKKLM